MTEEEKAEQERQKGWVKARLGCTMRTVFNRLAMVVRHDVMAYNAEIQTNQFKVDDLYDGTMGLMITSVRNAEDWIQIKAHECEIRVDRKHDLLFTITPQWVEDELECKLWINGNDKPMTYPRISQMALGDLMFPKGKYPTARKGG